METNPQQLTAQYVLDNYSDLIRKLIRESPHVPKDGLNIQDDVFADVMAALVQISPATGNTYLDRYDPAKSRGSVYIAVVVRNRLLRLRDTRVRHARMGVQEVELSEPQWEDSTTWYPDYDDNLHHEEVTDRISKLLTFTDKKYIPAIAKMLDLGMTAREAARATGVSPQALHYRLRKLRKLEPLRALALAEGYSVPPLESIA